MAGLVAGRPTRVVVALVDGVARWSVLDQGDAIAPRPLWSRGAELRCALVGISMLLLGGDHVRVEVDIGPGVTLELVEPAAVVAHRADAGPSSYATSVRVGAGATFVYGGAPFIVADDADVTRELTVALGSGARLLTRETLVLGRVGERGGVVDAHLRVSDDDGEMLVERLTLGTATGELPGIASGVRVVDSTVALGWSPSVPAGVDDACVLRPHVPGAIVRELVGRGTVVRGTIARSGAAVPAAASAAFEHWRSALRVNHV